MKKLKQFSLNVLFLLSCFLVVSNLTFCKNKKHTPSHGYVTPPDSNTVSAELSEIEKEIQDTTPYN